MSIQEVSVEQLAKVFHHYHELLAPDFNCGNERVETWQEISSNERQRMVAAMRLALQEIAVGQKENREAKPYFAKPGEAEWGC
jgi:hypothetical protein